MKSGISYGEQKPSIVVVETGSYGRGESMFHDAGVAVFSYASASSGKVNYSGESRACFCETEF
jgi:hypothetical protein